MAAGARFSRAFHPMGIAVDDLKVRETPEVEQRRPSGLAMLAPHAKQRNAMVDFGGFPEPPAGLDATVALDALEKLSVIARGRPKVPRHHAGCMPAGI